MSEQRYDGRVAPGDRPDRLSLRNEEGTMTLDTRPTGLRRVLRTGAGFGLVAVGGALLWPVAAAVVAGDLWRARHRA